MESQHPRILRRILTAYLPVIVLSSACDAPEPTSSAAVVRDSAGIQIVENPDLPAEALTTWRVEPEPLVRIGMVEGPEAQLLSGVAGAARLSDGRVVVLDGICPWSYATSTPTARTWRRWEEGEMDRESSSR